MSNNLDSYINSLIEPTLKHLIDNSPEEMWKNISAEQLPPQEERDMILVVEDCSVHQKIITRIVESSVEKLNLKKPSIMECQTSSLAKKIMEYQTESLKLKLIILDLTLSNATSGLDILNDISNDIPVVVISATKDLALIEKVLNHNNVYKFIKKGLESDDDKLDLDQVLIYLLGKEKTKNI